MPVTRLQLKAALERAEQSIRKNHNDAIAKTVADEAGNVSYEGILDRVIAEALRKVLVGHTVRRQLKRIDVTATKNGVVTVAVECKGMVSNSHKEHAERATDIFGINAKLKAVRKDMTHAPRKIPGDMHGPRWEVFIPVIYELYRSGGNIADWTKERKPWTTLPSFKKLRDNLTSDLAEWFGKQDSSVVLLHATRPIKLRRANELWLKIAQRPYPGYQSLDAYMSFHAFGRRVTGA